MRLWDERTGEWAEAVKRAPSDATDPLLLAASLVLVGACSGSSSSTEAGPSPSQSAPPSTVRAAAPAVDVSGPVEGGAGQATAAVQDLAARDYTESEYFYGGTATSYVGDHEADGVWDAREGERPSSGPG